MSVIRIPFKQINIEQLSGEIGSGGCIRNYNTELELEWPGVDATTLLAKVQAHIANADWGLSQDEIDIRTFASRVGTNYTNAEAARAMKALLRRAARRDNLTQGGSA